jgi:hypothetical protein
MLTLFCRMGGRKGENGKEEAAFLRRVLTNRHCEYPSGPTLKEICDNVGAGADLTTFKKLSNLNIR